MHPLNQLANELARFSCGTAHTVPAGFRTRDAAQENAQDPVRAATVAA